MNNKYRFKRYLLILSVILLFGIVLNSCQPENVEPDSNDPRSNIENTWDCQENSIDFGQQNYQVDIAIDPNYTDRVVIDNFFGLAIGVHAYAIMKNSQLTIPTQQLIVSSNDKYTISGYGTIASNYKRIDLNYDIDDGNGAKPVTATYTIQ